MAERTQLNTDAIVVSAVAKSILDADTESQIQQILNLEPGVDIQGYDADTLTATNTKTVSNKRNTKRVTTIVSSAEPVVNTDNCDVVEITALAADITSMTTYLTGTPLPYQTLVYHITGTAARAITWGASFEDGWNTLPSTTVLTEQLDVLVEWQNSRSKWRCLAVGSK